MKIRFLRDYRGVHTGEIFYPSGTEIESAAAAAIIAEGAAVAIPEPAPEPIPDPDAPTTPARKAKA